MRGGRASGAWLGLGAQDLVLGPVGVCRPAAMSKAEFSASMGTLDSRLEVAVTPASGPNRAGRGALDLMEGPSSTQSAPAQGPVVLTSAASMARSVAGEEVTGGGGGGGGGAPTSDVRVDDAGGVAPTAACI